MILKKMKRVESRTIVMAISISHRNFAVYSRLQLNKVRIRAAFCRSLIE